MRALLLAGSLSLGTLALGGLSPSMAHVGHGDEFQQTGNVRQVKASAEIDSLLGITTAPAVEAGGVVTIPVAAVVDADGKPLAFVKSGTTYDPVFLQTGASQGDQIEITDGSISPGDDVVIQGALSLYAESKKSQSSAIPSAEGSSSSRRHHPNSSRGSQPSGDRRWCRGAGGGRGGRGLTPGQEELTRRALRSLLPPHPIPCSIACSTRRCGPRSPGAGWLLSPPS
jgi:membrane fusion protein, cation efflux system